MSTREAVRYICDYCGGETERLAGYPPWFVVNQDRHSCSECGHGLMDMLVSFGVPHERSCGMYASPPVVGYINFDNDATITLEVATKKANKWRRPG